MGNMVINISKARKEFKQLIGQTNHFLITILVGLDGIKSGNVTLSSSFSTSWNPKNVQSSALRSRHFAIKATLAWCVDSLDGYFVMSCQEPGVVQDSTLIHTSLNKQSIFGKFKSFNRKYHVKISAIAVEVAMIELAITWRNRLVHFKSDNRISQSKRNLLVNSKSYIQTEYQGLDIEDLLTNYDGYKNPPRFKEVTALIRAIHKYIEILDAAVIANINYMSYSEAVIRHYINEKDGTLKEKRINDIWSRDLQTTQRKLTNILYSYGFEESSAPSTRAFSLNSNSSLVTLGVQNARNLF
ncbi:hypothetical protein [Bacillus velezensis]|uniref:hypothetical protein n=1 Tax=Bacillus velezensis TaxID=492670 RepID=UPI0013D56059|nr:hypothetical protein [Bacillus velezensis]